MRTKFVLMACILTEMLVSRTAVPVSEEVSNDINDYAVRNEGSFYENDYDSDIFADESMGFNITDEDNKDRSDGNEEPADESINLAVYAQLSDGLVRDKDGVWRLYHDGVIRESFTGLYPYGTSLFYLTNGVLDRTVSGIYYTQGTPYYVVNGQVTFTFTGLGEYKGSLHYFTESEKDVNFNGIAYYKGEPFYVVNGKVTFNYTGLGEYKGALHYFINSRKDTEFTGISYYMNEAYYVLNGVVSYKYNGLGQYKEDWWYVTNSKVDKTYSGIYVWKGAKYEVKSGKATEYIEPIPEPAETLLPVTQVTYVLNKSSKVFHKSTCSSVKKMKDSNKLYSEESRETIINQGYKPCSNCNP